jgi:hypothetical protein
MSEYRATLKDVIAAIGNSFIEAKTLMDELSAQQAKRYQEYPALMAQPLPFFALSEIDVTLNFVVQEVLPGKDVLVAVDSETLGRLPAHAVLRLECKLASQKTTGYKDRDGNLIFASEK